jgi:hypothetical protein
MEGGWEGHDLVSSAPSEQRNDEPIASEALVFAGHSTKWKEEESEIYSEKPLSLFFFSSVFHIVFYCREKRMTQKNLS